MEHYDDSDAEVDPHADPEDPAAPPSAAVIARALGGKTGGIILDDPYMQAAGDSSDEDDGAEGLEGMDSEEQDDYVLRGSDLLILAARSEDEVSTLEVWVYEEASSSTGEQHRGQQGGCQSSEAAQQALGLRLSCWHEPLLAAYLRGSSAELCVACLWLFSPVLLLSSGGNVAPSSRLCAEAAAHPRLCCCWHYAGGEANIYVHHDILLPAFPLALAWMNCDPAGSSSKANMVAVGTMDPGIEIWDLDIADAVEPACVLGGMEPAVAAEAAAAAAKDAGSKAAKKKARQKAKKKAAAAEKQLRPGSHSDAVLGLSWNAEYRNVLASCSADGTVKVWDVAAHKCEHTLSHHTDKVQAVAWNPAESPVLLTGSFDKTACLVSVLCTLCTCSATGNVIG